MVGARDVVGAPVAGVALVVLATEPEVVAAAPGVVASVAPPRIDDVVTADVATAVDPGGVTGG